MVREKRVGLDEETRLRVENEEEGMRRWDVEELVTRQWLGSDEVQAQKLDQTSLFSGLFFPSFGLPCEERMCRAFLS